METRPEALRKVREKGSNSIDPVRQLRRRNVRVAEQDHLFHKMLNGLYSNILEFNLKQPLPDDGRLLGHSHELNASDVEGVRPAVGKLREAPVHPREGGGGRVQRGHAALHQPERQWSNTFLLLKAARIVN